MRVIVIDNYDSFVYNLVQYVGGMGAETIVFRNDKIELSNIQRLKPDRIIISPGPGTPEDRRYFGACASIIKRLGPKIPILGVCLGHQGIAHAFGGKVVRANKIMHGKTSFIRHDGLRIYRGAKNPLEATRYHSLTVAKEGLPSSLTITAESLDDHEIMGIRHIKYPIEGVQFHPESIVTEEGKLILRNFLEEKKY